MEFDILGHSFHLLSEERQYLKLVGYIDKYILLNPYFDIGLALIAISCILRIASHWQTAECKEYLLRLRFELYLLSVPFFFLLCKDPAPRIVRLIISSWYVTPGGFHESRVLTSMVFLLYFIPLGKLFKGTGLVKGHAKRLALVLLLAVSIEVLQYLLGLGASGLYDIIAYSLGMLLGMVMQRSENCKTNNE